MVSKIFQKVRSLFQAPLESTKIYSDLHSAHKLQQTARQYSNMHLANEIVSLLQPTNVVDVGCGIGFLAGELEKNSVEVTSVEGAWLDTQKFLGSLDRLIIRDLEKPFDLDKKFDVCVSIEVAEHLEQDRAEGFVSDLTMLSDVIVFSAAIPGQGGIDHKNEQWQQYWAEKFESLDFKMFDPFRAAFHEDSEIFGWFRQNILLYIKRGNPLSEKLIEFQIPITRSNLVLPELYTRNLKRGRNGS